jgi:hypothetical protein
MDEKIYLVAKDKEFEIVTDYLNGVSEEKYFEEEMSMFEKLEKFYVLKTYEERWDFIENEFGGNILEAKEYGWLSLNSYSPNIVIKRESREFYLAYLLDLSFQPHFKVELENIKDLLIHWIEIVRVFKK